MKKVMFDINYMYEYGIGFAIFCVGFQTRRNLYVKVEDIYKPEKKYLKVRKKDTEVNDSCWSVVGFDVYRDIEVPGSMGLLDERLQTLEDETIIRIVDTISEEYNRKLYKILR